MVNPFPSMKAMLASGDQAAQAAFKKTMPGMESKDFYKEFDNLHEAARQESYYLKALRRKNTFDIGVQIS